MASSTGKADYELLYRDDEPRLTVEQAGRPWSMDGNGSLFRTLRFETHEFDA